MAGPVIQSKPTTAYRRRQSEEPFLVLSAVLCYIIAGICLIKGIYTGYLYAQSLMQKPDELGLSKLAAGMNETFLVLYIAGFVGLLGIGQCCSKLSRL